MKLPVAFVTVGSLRLHEAVSFHSCAEKLEATTLILTYRLRGALKESNARHILQEMCGPWNGGEQLPAISQLVGALEYEAMRCEAWHIRCASPCGRVVLMAAGDTASCQQLVYSTLEAPTRRHLHIDAQT